MKKLYCSRNGCSLSRWCFNFQLKYLCFESIQDFKRVCLMDENEIWCTFLAAMSSSRSDDVTKFVCLFVCLSVCLESFCLILRIQSIWSKMFWGSCKGISGVYVWSFKEVSRVFQGSSKGVQVRLKGISSSFKEFERSSTGTSEKFPWCFKEVSKMF